MREGVILAAGFGSRLNGQAVRGLKPLTRVAGVPLLARTVRSLRIAGCERVVVVVGFGADAVATEARRELPREVEVVFVTNPRYDLKNGISVLAAQPHLRGDEFVLAMADHVLGDEVMGLARTHSPAAGTATLLVDSKLDTIFDMDDATKVRVLEDRIVEIGKELKSFSHVDCGVFVCTRALPDAIDEVYQRTGNASLSEGVQALANAGRMHPLDIGNGFWQDIDTPEMLAHAERVLSRIAGIRRAG